MSAPTPIVTLLTDFGDLDAYVGVLKGVLLAKVPDARIVDLTHRIPPQAVHSAAYVLETAYPWFPPGTIHVAVVDPGVGTDRAIVGVRIASGAVFLAPDNGLLTPVLDAESVGEAVRIERVPGGPRNVSPTFHGRDVFAPAAAHLARGKALLDLGSPAGEVAHLPDYRAVHSGEGLEARVLHVDRFGNAITAARREDVADPAAVEVLVGDRSLGAPRRTYADAARGEPLALLGSSGHLEIAVRDRSAARELGLAPGDVVRIRSRRDP